MTGAQSDHERRQRQWRHNHAPDNEVASSIPLDAVLGRTPVLVVVLLSARVFSTGIELEVMARLRHVGEAQDSGLNHNRRGPVRSHAGDDVMQLAVEYSAGRWAAGSHRGQDHDQDVDAPAFIRSEFAGNDTMQDSRYWLAPLPDAGDVTLVFSWPYRGMAETRTVISAAMLAQAWAEVVELGPYEPEPEPDDGPV